MEDIKKLFTNDLEGLMKMFLEMKQPKDVRNVFPGRVVNNSDPRKLGCCKVMVYGQYDGLSEEDIPWAFPDQSFVGSPAGNFVVPEVGTEVNVYFRNGDRYHPHYTTKVIERENLSDLVSEDYPATMIIFETPRGDSFSINKKTNEWVLRAAAGSGMTINASGNIDFDTLNSLVGMFTIKARSIFEVDAPIIKFPAGNVAPTGTGPFCAMPIDPITGAPQTGNIEIRT